MVRPFLLLVFLAELPVEHRALGSISVYGDGPSFSELKAEKGHNVHFLASKVGDSYEVGVFVNL